MEELKSLLPEAIVGDELFISYLLSFPKTLSYTRRDLAVLRAYRTSTVPFELEAARDAANKLLMIAQEAGFVRATSVFYAIYEQLCLKLLSWYSDY